ncbi:hypothetical protein ScPMuIL_004657 [Solemya velum]
MLALVLVASVVIALCGVLLVFGCLCHFFRKKQDLSNFVDGDAEYGRGYSMFDDDGAETSSSSQVTFEPLPDILAKTVTATALRPRISSLEKDKQEHASKLVRIHQPFARSQLTYVNELGIGWFGQVLQGDADSIIMGTKKSKVVVKLLKDDASLPEQKLFLEEVAPYRELDHPNILRLLGQCSEALPYLVIMEYSSYNDLKSYLMTVQSELELFHQRGLVFKFAVDIATGLACMHRHKYIHHDIAARNCMVMADLTVKVGDYGIAEDQFRADYYDTGQDLLPIRWMAPESLTMKSDVWSVVHLSKESNIWSFGVVLWEIAEFGALPYKNLTDETVLQDVINQKSTQLPPPTLPVLQREQMYEIMKFCWRDASQRPSIEEIHTLLRQLPNIETGDGQSDFETKWHQSSSNEPKVAIVQPPTTQFESDFVPKETISKYPAPSTDSNHQAAKSESKSNFAPSLSFPSSTEISMASSAEKQRDGSSSDSKIPTISSFNSDIASRQTATKTPDMLELNNSLLESDSFIITGGMTNDSHGEEEANANQLMITLPTDVNLVPIEMSTPNKKHSTNTTATSTSTEFYSTLESQPLSSGSDEYLSPITNSDKSDLNHSGNDLKGELVALEKKEDSVIAENVNEKDDRDIENKVSSEDSDRHPLDVNNEDSFVVLKGDMMEELDNIFELPASPSKNSDQSEVTADSSDIPESPNPSITSSPSREEIEVAKELYISRGTSLNTSKNNTPRSLTTIPEDRIPLDNSIAELHFDEQMEDSFFTVAAQDSFEWDDYIGEQLVGKVQYPDPSPKQTLEMTDWTFDHDSAGGSNPSSISKDELSSIASDTRTSSVASDKNSSSVFDGEGEVKNVSGGSTHSFIADILTTRLTPRSTNLVGQSNFYSILNAVDVDLPSDSDTASPILRRADTKNENHLNESQNDTEEANESNS